MSTTQRSTGTVETLMHRSLLDVFNERDAERRAAAIAAVYSADVTFYEADDAVHGPAALGARVQQLLAGAPGWVFRPAGVPSVNHNLGRLTWHFGPEGAPAAVTGTDVAIVEDGRIRSLYAFIHAPGPGPQA
jgi:hypothetical protein